MNTIEDFKRYCTETFYCTPDTASYRERVGDPDEVTSVIGMIALRFADLEDKLCEIIAKMLQLDSERGDIVTCELSFKQKVNLFASLYHQLKGKYYFNVLPGFEDEYFQEIIKWLNRCEENRNRIFHSTLIGMYGNSPQLVRKKITAKQKHGLSRVEVETSVVEMFNIADNICSLTFELDEFQINIMDPLP